MPFLAALALALVLLAPALGRPALAAGTPPGAAVDASPGAAPRGSWRRPVLAAVARPFAYGAGDPFRAGQHRGIDFVAPPGTEVRAACSGVVATARPGLVTLRCGPWRVTHLPLASASVAEGAPVRAGRVIGRVGAGGEHRGLHLGVRRAGDRFAYVDPLSFLRGRTGAPPTVPPPRTTRVPRSGPGRARPSSPSTPAPEPMPAPHPAAAPAVPPEHAPGRAEPIPASPPAVPPEHAPSPPPAAAPAVPPEHAPGSSSAAARTLPPVPTPGVRVSSPEGARGLAPWPAWVGLALLLVGAVGGGVRVRVRRARARIAAPVPSSR